LGVDAAVPAAGGGHFAGQRALFRTRIRDFPHDDEVFAPPRLNHIEKTQ
jgi:hypothetical protein